MSDMNKICYSMEPNKLSMTPQTEPANEWNKTSICDTYSIADLFQIHLII